MIIQKTKNQIKLSIMISINSNPIEKFEIRKTTIAKLISDSEAKATAQPGHENNFITTTSSIINL